MNNQEDVKNGILLRIERYLKICKIDKIPVDMEKVDRLTDQFIELLKKELENE